MKTSHKLLLVSVYAPFGRQSPYEEGDGMQMELLNNQVTREQGIHSPRKQGTRSYGLHLLAENISVPTVVLDFPSWRQFTRELKNGYTHVGIGFICQNVLKAGRMARFIRECYPEVKIILGGAGAQIPELERYLPYDALCKGEGVSWLRRYFKEDPAAPITGCVFSGKQSYYVYGFKTTFTSTSVFPGLGCPNGCEFCATTHQFGKRYIPLIATGRDLYRILEKEEAQHGVRDFTVEDENFLIHRQLVIDLLSEMEKRAKAYSFFCFASAETIRELGVEFMVRLGIDTVWIGIESRTNRLAKLKDIDLKALIVELRAKGIKVLGSVILFQDHHDRENIRQEIQWVIDLQTDLLQLLGLAPCPGTKLFERMLAAQRLDREFPYHKQTGLGPIYFQHPQFDPAETGPIVTEAYRKNLAVNGPSLLNIIQTTIGGYRQLKSDVKERLAKGMVWNPESRTYEKSEHPVPDRLLENRLRLMEKSVRKLRPLLPTLYLFAPNTRAREKCRLTMKTYRQVVGRATLSEIIKATVLLVFACHTSVTSKFRQWSGLGEKVYQPRQSRTEFNIQSLRTSSIRHPVRHLFGITMDSVSGSE